MGAGQGGGRWFIVAGIAVAGLLLGSGAAHAGGQTWRLYDSSAGRDFYQSSSMALDVSSSVSTQSTKRSGSRRGGNKRPELSGAPASSVAETALYAFEPTATDPDGDTLTFGITNKPSWASFSAATGLLSGVPPLGSAGTYSNIVISASDGRSTASLPSFSITVNAAPNQPPAIWGVPPTSIEAGNTYSFRPSASDPEGKALRFSVSGLPSWATLDTATGIMSGAPTATQAGTYPGITISVSDGQASASLAPFSIQVTASNLPPTISGVPSGSVTSGDPYAFQPTARDPEGQKLAFSIANKPAWAQFDAATGRLSGTPTDASAGTYASIRISVSDGQYSAALPAFSIVVQKELRGSATLSWVPPTTNVDGTPISNLAGYRIAYGQSSSDLTQSLEIPSPGITTAAIENLAVGTWYFAVKAYTTANVESELSNLAQKTIL